MFGIRTFIPIMLKASFIIAVLIKATYSFASDNGSGFHCCPFKEIYGHLDSTKDGLYKNVGVLPPNHLLPHGCYDSCVYIKEGGDGTEFCMARTDETISECVYSGYSTSGYSVSSGNGGNSGFGDCLERVTMAIFTLQVRSSQDNSPIVGAKASVDAFGCLDEYFSNDDGYININITVLVTYVIHISGPGLINRTIEYEAETFEDKTELVPISPTLDAGEVRIMMSWESMIVDVDIHMVGIRKDGSGDYCRTYYASLSGCPGTSLDLDNTGTGLDGSETITLEDININLEYIYVIGVEHFNQPVTQEYLDSRASVTITNNTITVTETIGNGTIPNFPIDTWFAGCVTVESEGQFMVRTAPEQLWMVLNDESAWAEMAHTYCGGPPPVEESGFVSF